MSIWWLLLALCLGLWLLVAVAVVAASMLSSRISNGPEARYIEWLKKQKQ